MSNFFATLWTTAPQALLSMGFPRQEYWTGLHFLLQGIFPTQRSNVHALAGRFFTTEPPGKPDFDYACLCVKLLKLCLTLCSPMDYSLPDSSVHGVLQARILEWVAVSFSRGSSRPRDRTEVSRIVDRHFTV